jgi:hypothetical protein
VTPFAAAGALWVVGPTGDFPDLQTALDAIQPGDTLLLDGDVHGSYRATVDCTIAPLNGPVTLFTDGSSGNPDNDGFLQVDGASVTVRGVTMNGGGQYRLAHVTGGGALSLDGVTLRRGYAENDGGAVLVDQGSLDTLGATFVDCAADEGGGAISAGSGTTVLVVDSAFQGNVAGGRGGAVSCSGYSCALVGSTLWDNSAGLDGGAVWMGASLTSVSQNWFCGNVANGDGGAVRLGGAGYVLGLSDSVFWANKAADGGGVYAPLLVAEPARLHFLENEGSEGAAAFSGLSSTTLYDVLSVGHSIGDTVYSGVLVDHGLSFDDTMLLGVFAVGMVYAPPDFVDPAYPADCDVRGLQLLPGSPALGTGDGLHGDDLGAFQCGGFEIPGDGIDSDCDGLEICYVDYDGDGFGAPSGSPQGDWTCTGPGLAPVGGDCDESDPYVHPGATEVPGDSTDENCDGIELCYRDRDADGFGGPDLWASTYVTCDAAGAAADDCDDDRAAVHPGATEQPADGVDQDCSGDDLCWVDADDDGHYTAAVGPVGCADASPTDDCDDAAGDVFPGAPEPCDGRDHDCDGLPAADCAPSTATSGGSGAPADAEWVGVAGGSCGCSSGGGGGIGLAVAALALTRRRSARR